MSTTINTTKAAARMLAYKTDTGADCLHVVSEAIRDGKPVLKNSPTALSEWNNTPTHLRHPGEVPPGPGYPMYFTCANTGDVCLSGPKVNPMVAIDTNGKTYEHGHINYQSIADREKQLNGKYMGYTEAMSGYTIDNTVKLTKTQREVSINESRIRDEPNINSTILSTLKKDTIVTVNGYTNEGAYADGTSNWYHVTKPKVGWINAALIEGGLVMDDLTNMTNVSTPTAPVITSPVTGPVTTDPVVIPPIESEPVVTDPVLTNPIGTPNPNGQVTSTTPIIKFDPTQGSVLGSDLGDVADAALTPLGRQKLYNIMTVINRIAAPVYLAGGAAALFVGGQIGTEIVAGVGVLGVINSLVTSFTTKLASNNVTK